MISLAPHRLCSTSTQDIFMQAALEKDDVVLTKPTTNLAARQASELPMGEDEIACALAGLDPGFRRSSGLLSLRPCPLA